jgi:hypothetical protein
MAKGQDNLGEKHYCDGKGTHLNGLEGFRVFLKRKNRFLKAV